MGPAHTSGALLHHRDRRARRTRGRCSACLARGLHGYSEAAGSPAISPTLLSHRGLCQEPLPSRGPHSHFDLASLASGAVPPVSSRKNQPLQGTGLAGSGGLQVVSSMQILRTSPSFGGGQRTCMLGLSAGVVLLQFPPSRPEAGRPSSSRLSAPSKASRRSHASAPVPLPGGGRVSGPPARGGCPLVAVLGIHQRRDPPRLAVGPASLGGTHPLQYPCAEKSVDRGAWRATVHGAAKSWTRLSASLTRPAPLLSSWGPPCSSRVHRPSAGASHVTRGAPPTSPPSSPGDGWFLAEAELGPGQLDH